MADKGGDEQVSTATRILAEVIASDAACLVVFNGAIDHIIQSLINSLTGDLQKFGLDRAPRLQTLEEFVNFSCRSINGTMEGVLPRFRHKTSTAND